MYNLHEIYPLCAKTFALSRNIDIALIHVSYIMSELIDTLVSL